MRKLAFILMAWLALGSQDALWADSPIGCRLIDDIVKDIETGTSPWLLDARFTLIETKTDRVETVRRYSMRLPRIDASEVMQLEIVDAPYYRAWEAELGVRRLRVRPNSVSHWIAVLPSAVVLDIYDMDAPCVQAKGEACTGFAINFESKDGGLAVGFLFAFTESKRHIIDHVTLSLRAPWCTTSDMFDK